MIQRPTDRYGCLISWQKWWWNPMLSAQNYHSHVLSKIRAAAYKLHSEVFITSIWQLNISLKSGHHDLWKVELKTRALLKSKHSGKSFYSVASIYVQTSTLKQRTTRLDLCFFKRGVIYLSSGGWLLWESSSTARQESWTLPCSGRGSSQVGWLKSIMFCLNLTL